jgi:L-cysteine S-thiosulfotransferase
MPAAGMPVRWPKSMVERSRCGTLAQALAAAGLSLGLLPGLAAAQDLVSYRVEGQAIPEPLTESPGNPARGREIVRNINQVPCLICHQMPIPQEPDHGSIGPPLIGVGSRLSRGELRLRVVDSSVINPQTIMPPYYRVEGLHRVGADYRGRPIYTAQMVEDVVAYLASLVE